MATCLDDYQSMKDTMAQQFSEGNVSLEQSMTYQELLYRIGVLETCRMPLQNGSYYRGDEGIDCPLSVG